MGYSFYWILLLLTNGILIFMGLHLIFGAITPELKGSIYHTARRYAGAAFSVTPIASFIFNFLEVVYDERVYLATAVNLTSFYLTAVLFSIAFLNIIGNRLNKLRKRFISMEISFLVYLIPTWGPIVFNNMEIIKTCHIISNIILCTYVIIILIYIYIVYKDLITRIDDYYSEEIAANTKWIKSSLLLFIGLGLITLVAPFSNHYNIILCLIYVIYQASVYTYIYSGFHRFEITTLSLADEAESDDTEPIPTIISRNNNINEETASYIEKRLNEWIKQEYYTVQGLTIKSVAAQICTNRTYLSSYINTKYKQPFKEWITILRIDESKKLLFSNTEYGIAEIASKVGFLSENTFINNFKKIEGIDPIKWREKNKSFKQIN